jgi:hypothetical protein
MALIKSLIARGVASEVANLVGFRDISITTTAATQGSAGGLLKSKTDLLVRATVATDGHAITMPSELELGHAVVVFNKSAANEARIYPPVGHSFNNGTANQYATMPVNGFAGAIRLTATSWLVSVSATITLT